MTDAELLLIETSLERWFMGNVPAVRLGIMLTQAAHLVDDLVDGTAVPPAHARAVCRMMLLEIPSNLFYRQNFEFLSPLMAQCWLQWVASDTMERGVGLGVDDRAKCYMLRASLYGLFHGMAVLVGGLDWAEKVGPDIYRTYGEKLEDFDA